MPFGLKNDGAMFMRMIHKCVLTQISWNVEAYMDDIMVKSRKSSDLLTDLAETFDNSQSIFVFDVFRVCGLI